MFVKFISKFVTFVMILVNSISGLIILIMAYVTLKIKFEILKILLKYIMSQGLVKISRGNWALILQLRS